jgi:hypothetical protein
MQLNIKYCMQLVHNDALLDSSIYIYIFLYKLDSSNKALHYGLFT